MERRQALLHTIAPLRFVAYLFVCVLFVYFGLKWALVFTAQASLWESGECWRDSCEYLPDNRVILHGGYVVIGAMVVALAILRDMTARRSVSRAEHKTWPWA